MTLDEYRWPWAFPAKPGTPAHAHAWWGRWWALWMQIGYQYADDSRRGAKP